MIEFIGFLITLLAMVYLATQQMWQKPRKDTYLDDEEESEEERYHREALAALYAKQQEVMEEVLMIEKEQAPPPTVVKQKVPTPKKELRAPPKRTLADSYSLHTNIEDRHPTSAIEEREFDTSVEHRYDAPRQSIVSQGLRIDPQMSAYVISEEEPVESKAHKLLVDRKRAILLHAIIGKPRAVEPYDELF